MYYIININITDLLHVIEYQNRYGMELRVRRGE